MDLWLYVVWFRVSVGGLTGVQIFSFRVFRVLSSSLSVFVGFAGIAIQSLGLMFSFVCTLLIWTWCFVDEWFGAQACLCHTGIQYLGLYSGSGSFGFTPRFT